MAFPVVQATNTSLEDGASVNDHTVNLPSGIVSGDLLIVVFGTDGNPTVNFPAGWTIFAQSTGPASFRVAYRNADGTEGATITVTTVTKEKTAHCSFRITGNDQANPPDEAASTNEGTSTTPNADNNDQGGSAEDYLWIAVAVNDRDPTLSSFPTNYTENQLNSRGTTATSCGTAAATRNLNASAEDVGDFTISATEEWVAATIAVHPGVVEDALIIGMPQLQPRSARRPSPLAFWIPNLLAVPEEVFTVIRPMPQLHPRAAARAAPLSYWMDNLLAVPELEFPPIRPMPQLHPRAAPRAAPLDYWIENRLPPEPAPPIRPMDQLHPRARRRAAPIDYWIDNLLAAEEFPPIRPMDQLHPRARRRGAPYTYWLDNWLAVEELAEDLPPGIQMQVRVYRVGRASPLSYMIQGLIAVQIQPPPAAVGGARGNQADTMVIAVFV